MQKKEKKMIKRRSISIDRNKTIGLIQKEFNAIFPFLSIEFFKEPCVKGQMWSKDKKLTPEVRLGQVLNLKHIGVMSFTGSYTVTQLEENFREKFGLCVQVFRKCSRD